jgi:hypothetical protein
MGFRGSRVQIPPSRLARTDPVITCRTGLFLQVERLPLGLPFLLTDGSFSHLSLLVHHGEQGVVVGLLITAQQGSRVFPPTRGCHVFERKMLALRRPLPAIRMPESPSSVVEQVPIHGLDAV